MEPGIVQTVLGPVATGELGVTMPHEHLLLDEILPKFAPEFSSHVSAWRRAQWTEPLTLANHYENRREGILYRDNMALDSIAEAIAECADFRLHGGSAIVDLTSIGLGRDPVALRQISLASGVHVVMGSGHYVFDYHRPDLAGLGADAIRDEIVAEARSGITELGIRPGIIGEVGLSWPVHPQEDKVARACAQASAESGLALSIHPGRSAEAPLDACGRIDRYGGDLSRTVIGHIDRTLFDIEDMDRLARTGCYLEFDLFGQEEAYSPWNPGLAMPNDGMRIHAIMELAGRGFGDQLLISQDIGSKARTQAYGGEGRSHIVKRVVPFMRMLGAGDDLISQLLIANPARMLRLAG